MRLKDPPTSLHEAETIVHNYVESDDTSRLTNDGIRLRIAIDNLVQRCDTTVSLSGVE